MGEGLGMFWRYRKVIGELIWLVATMGGLIVGMSAL